MAVEKTVIELDEKDINSIMAEKYNLDITTVQVKFNYYAGDAREPEYKSLIVTGQKVSK